MMLTGKHLLDHTAQDIMSREVVTLPRGLSLRAAARHLAQAGVSGAPVVDEEGHCIGVLSKTDLVRFLEQRQDFAHVPDPTLIDCFADWQVIDPDTLPSDDDVTRYMSARPITAMPDARLPDLARLMCQERIHRVLITDSGGKLLGVVSSMDILAAVAAEDSFGGEVVQAFG